jgi:hypothetical protein
MCGDISPPRGYQACRSYLPSYDAGPHLDGLPGGAIINARPRMDLSEAINALKAPGVISEDVFLRSLVAQAALRAGEMHRDLRSAGHPGRPRIRHLPYREPATIKLTHDPWPRIWRVTLQARPRSVDRTRSPAAVSRKREYFKYLPETISDFAPTAAGFGARRRIADSQKPAIGGHFSPY